jgi:tRNA dimethylallyltransferase
LEQDELMNDTLGVDEQIRYTTGADAQVTYTRSIDERVSDTRGADAQVIDTIDILVIVGPTAVGKTKFAIEQAIKNNGEIVSADAMQIYKGFDIGSAKPDAAERAQAVHHLIDFVDPGQDFSVADYQGFACRAIRDIAGRGKLPIVVGGTGLYVNSIIYDMDFCVSPKQDEFRNRLHALAEERGADFVHDMLKAKDPEAAGRIHPNNVKKVIRALEILEQQDFGEGQLRAFSESFKPRTEFRPVIIGLNRERGELYRRIEERVEKLMEAGLAAEVEGLINAGLTISHISMKGIGYKELWGYFQREYDLDYAVYLIKRNSRRYAKRQLTWFKRYAGIKWYDLD